MIRVKVDMRTVQRDLGTLARKARHPRRGLEAGAEAARKVEERWFGYQGSGRHLWAPLAERTELARGLEGVRSGYYQRHAPAGAGPSEPVLFWTGRLMRSLTKKGAKGSVARLKGRSTFVFGTDYESEGFPVALVMNDGTDSIPARPLLDEKGIAKVYRAAIADHMKVKNLGMG